MKSDDFMIIYRYKSKVFHYTNDGFFTVCGKAKKDGWFQRTVRTEIFLVHRDECKSCLKILKRESIP